MSPAPARRRLIFTVFTRYSGAREYTNPLNPKPVASMLLQGLLSAYSYYMLYQNGAVGRPGSRLQLLHEFHHLLLPIPVDAWWAGVGSICMSRRRFAWVSLPARPRQTGQDRVPATVAVPVPPPTRPQGVQLGAFLFFLAQFNGNQMLRIRYARAAVSSLFDQVAARAGWLLRSED
jgi:hypothetical protein